MWNDFYFNKNMRLKNLAGIEKKNSTLYKNCFTIKMEAFYETIIGFKE